MNSVFRRFIGIPPPQGRESGYAITRQRVRMAEAIPAGRAQLAVAPLRNKIIVPQQDAERLGRGGKTVLVYGEHNMLDHLIDRGIFDPYTLLEPDWSAACVP